jgi:WD40 repeat protein
VDQEAGIMKLSADTLRAIFCFLCGWFIHASWPSGGLQSCFSPDAQTVMTFGVGHTLEIVDTATGLHRAQLESVVARYAIFAPRLPSILCAVENELELRDMGSGQLQRKLQGRHSSYVTQCCISACGRWCLSSSADATINVHDVETGKHAATLNGHSAEITCCSFSKDGSLILSGSIDTTLKLWDFKSRGCCSTFEGHVSPVFHCDMSPCGKLCLGCGQKQARGRAIMVLWNRSSLEVEKRLVGHTDNVYSCCFNGTGETILSASADTTIKLWSTATGLPSYTLRGHTHVVRSACFSPCEKFLLSCGDDQAVLLWVAAYGAVLL